MALLRSNIDFAKKIFADRLPYGGSEDSYVYGGTWDPNDPSVGTDCSGLVTDILSACVHGPDMIWGREGLSTEAYRDLPLGPQTVGPFDLVHVSSFSDFPPEAVVRISLHHGPGGGGNSHMNCWCDGVYMESNGDVGICTLGTGAMAMSNPYWGDWYYLGGPIIESTINTLDPIVLSAIVGQLL